MNKMSTTTAARTDAIPEGDQCVELRDIDWKGYQTMLRLRGERSVPKMVYLDGRLSLVSPSLPHEDIKTRLGQLVIEVLLTCDIPFRATAQTTFRRRKRQVGVEGDQTYYIANVEAIRGKNNINLRIDPPPDLAVEAVYSHDAAAAVEVYRRLRVPEVWVCDGADLQILVRKANGRYGKARSSLAFPFLSASEILDWVKRVENGTDLDWGKALRKWVQDELLPRAKREPGGPAEREK
jgi:Uma2 family endonuclease